jgi:PHD/YefM family antitoxin component YafN of YafNO toxin-antitoxin module
MHISTDIKSVTYLKSKAADVLKQINETHRPMRITQNGEVASKDAVFAKVNELLK